MLQAKPYVFWFVTGSQGLYGEDVLEQVEENSRRMVEELNREGGLPYPIEFRETVTAPEAILRVCLEANSSGTCAGGDHMDAHLLSGQKCGSRGLTQLRKPLLHLHTQYNIEIPWDSIDMEFMNLNQAAHGDREFGFIGARLRMPRKIIAGHWKDEEVRARIGGWMKTAAGYTGSQTMRIARFGDNMRDVAVTEGDKVEAQIKLGWTVNGYPAGDLAERVRSVSEAKLRALMDEYAELYDFTDQGRTDGAERGAIREQARMEIALSEFFWRRADIQRS
ncbi:hypothetical protein ACFTAO_40440 [Paenibacillus rhizoplanae]